MVPSSCGPSRLQDPASLLPPTFTSRRAKTAVFCEVSPRKAPVAPLADLRAVRGNYFPDAPAPLPVGRSNFVLPPPPRGTGVGGRPGPGSALGRPPSRQRPPLGCWAWWWWLEGVEPPVTGLHALVIPELGPHVGSRWPLYSPGACFLRYSVARSSPMWWRRERKCIAESGIDILLQRSLAKSLPFLVFFCRGRSA